MEIRTERLLLKPADLSYLYSTHEYASDLENTRFMMFLPYESLEETENILREAQDAWKDKEPALYEFMILLDGVHIGEIMLFMQEDRSEAELAWLLNKKYWNRGYVTEAAFALVEFGREQLALRRIFAMCDGENMPSRRVMEKIGMHLSGEGTRTNRSMGDEIRQELIYEMWLNGEKEKKDDEMFPKEILK